MNEGLSLWHLVFEQPDSQSIKMSLVYAGDSLLEKIPQGRYMMMPKSNRVK